MPEKSAEMTDNELVQFSKRSPDAFSEIVLRYQDRLFRYIKRISYFADEDIEDIIQETFIKAYKSLNIFDNDLKFSSWIYQIARNATIDAIRKKQARPQAMYFEENDVLKFFQSDIDVHIQAEARNHLDIIRKIIDELPYKYKEVLVLRFLEDKNYEEIMDIIQKPKGTVAALINRGRKMLLKEASNKFGINN
ncbi:MAG TPA: sigma-70 family RNA polymerase sigma factor [Candidatus Moranbacteria bacterium]|nr:sigma-70 family RNA polymerase sigma factor [Candidatus Moranbacteria bacterium]HRZ33451.1 sigma-70 family RNA polymerase sigma factor [Candidatus Moranbacteria bacterium]